MNPEQARIFRNDLATYNAGVIAAINAYRTSEHGERQCARCGTWTKTTRVTCEACRPRSKRKATS